MKLKTPIGLAALTRTAFGKHAGALSAYQPHELIARVLAGVASRTVRNVDEVMVGCVRNGIGNLGRVGALAAGLDVSIPAMTIDRQCASSLEALMIAAAKIGSGMCERVLVGGVESSTHGPWFMEKTARPYNYGEPKPFRIRLSTDDIGDPNMGETAEILADEFGITREQMDAFASESHQRAAKATAQGAFDNEILPLPIGTGDDKFTRDEPIRPGTSIDKLAILPPVFRKDGRVTAGTSSPLTDGASAVFAAALTAFDRDGIKPQAVLRGINVVALDPKRMGMGPALAIPALLEAHGLKQTDIDLFEINEAFAAQILAVNHELNIPPNVLNIHGGALAIGHPFGATGVRLVATLANALKAGGGKRGVASLCVAGGHGMAALIEV